jgi:hypothetical protein
VVTVTPSVTRPNLPGITTLGNVSLTVTIPKTLSVVAGSYGIKATTKT